MIKNIELFINESLSFLLLEVPLRSQGFDHFGRCAADFFIAEIEQVGRHLLVVRETGLLLAEVVEERLLQALHGFQSLVWIVLQDFVDQVDGFVHVGAALAGEYFDQLGGLDLWELELGIVGVHGMDLVSTGCAQDLDDLDQLVHARVAWEDWLA